MFTKAFEGEEYGDVVVDCYAGDKNCIISFKQVVYFKSLFGYGEHDYLFEYECKSLIVHNYEKTNPNFKNIQNFLNHFKIPLEDIV